MNIVYFVHNFGDPAVLRRVDMLVAGGARVSVVGFRRGDQPAIDRPGVAVIELGRSYDARLAQRAALVARACWRAGDLADVVSQADVTIARNLEMLAVAASALRRARSRAPLVYECLDIHRLMLGAGRAGAALRFLERRLLRRCSLLIVSSPAFAELYFKQRQNASLPTLLVENKLLRLDLETASTKPHSAASGPPWRIGWFGMIRCQKSLDFLCDLAARRPGFIEVDIRGLPSLSEFRDFSGQIESAPGVVFHGPYTRDDLDRHYGSVHFAWAIDFFEEGLNSDWLLPNRLYESLAHGVPPIALAHVETGRWLKRHRAGLVLRGLSELSDRLQSIDAEAYAAQVLQARSVPAEDVIATRRDARDLVVALTSLS